MAHSLHRPHFSPFIIWPWSHPALLSSSSFSKEVNVGSPCLKIHRVYLPKIRSLHRQKVSGFSPLPVFYINPIQTEGLVYSLPRLPVSPQTVYPTPCLPLISVDVMKRKIGSLFQTQRKGWTFNSKISWISSIMKYPVLIKDSTKNSIISYAHL